MNAVIVNGVFVGCIYGLLAVGLVVVYRGSGVINFAHGQVGMLAAFFFTDMRFGTTKLGAPLDRGLWSLPIAVLIATVLGAVTELAVVRPLRNAPRIRPLVGTFAIGTLMALYAARRWGTNSRYTGTLITGKGVKILGLQVQPGQILILAVSVAVLVGLWLLYRFTPFGLRLRAVALDPYAAGLVGVNVNLTSVATWALAGALSGLSAILIAPLVSFNVAFMTTLSIRGLAAALIGGLSNVGGAFAAGILIGVAEAIISFKTSTSGLTDVAVAALVLGLMMLRPAGLARGSA